MIGAIIGYVVGGVIVFMLVQYFPLESSGDYRRRMELKEKEAMARARKELAWNLKDDDL